MENAGNSSHHQEDLVLIHNVPMLKSIANNWEQVEGFQARPDDLIIATYPKAGTTWVSEIVDIVHNNGDVAKSSQAPIYYRVPYMEFFMHPEKNIPGMRYLNSMASPRLIKTHLPVQLLPKSMWENKCKIIYMARNAKDVAVSFFYFHHNIKALPDVGTWEEFLQKYIAGKVSYGSWHDHVKGWWKKRQEHPILYLFYEDMKEDPANEIRKLMRFLEKDLREEVLEKIIHHTSFQFMKKNPMTNYEGLSHDTVFPFMRKGITGDWKNHFTVAQNEIFDADYARKMEGSGLQFRTEI
ncbi:sulfotransferase 1 family member D1 [Microcaecilia unicolor]|uniref:Sulfotransferase n=1 Tax=Microcaecilia unicolor TaxID=1415580 RepID=A0A6P7YIE9_9AMPH|nr:sulfotransferase 1 family member D1-like [Microcaecilia unicolor]XP_030064675.1 sulfotransferase 1 family member D1-like [Microcaecilia unicolor]XP_030064676.1 sulfotransferase 1 family member D1-like [Microcaecilia unicolor]XP_030064677.1 sulfotransferase 1 family member D1-like [Microcaecilia unicolor]